MDIPDNVLAAKEAIAGPLLQAGLITGIAFGVRDEDNPDPDDLVLRVFVADASAVPDEVNSALDGFPFPTDITQRVFQITNTPVTVTLPDTQSYRPVQGGCSVAAARFASAGIVYAGTLGAVVQDLSDPQKFYGLSNFHVLCVDANRQTGDVIYQPEPSLLGPLPNARAGTLDRWMFPETDPSGPLDAALFVIEVASDTQIIDVGGASGTIGATPGMLVTKRGRTTGQTFGVVTHHISGDYAVNYPMMPPVSAAPGSPPTTYRTLTNQIQVRADFPQSVIFGDHGDSGSLVVSAGQAVGLYWGSGSVSDGDPLEFGLVSPASTVALALGISFLISA